jgi:CRAL/TRIO domain
LFIQGSTNSPSFLEYRSRTRNFNNFNNTTETESNGVGITFGMFTLSPLRSSNQQSRRRPSAGANHRETSGELSILRLREELGFEVLERIEATGEAVDDAFLLKWLHARGPDIVADSIRQHAAWREAFVGRNRLGISAESISEELGSEKIFLQGLDHHGCSVLLFLISRHCSGAAPAEATNRLLTFAIDNACAAADLKLNRERKVCCIFNLAGVKISRNVDINFLRGVFDLLQTHFPETLSKLYFIDAPLLFLGVWKCVTPFLQPATKSKIVFLSGAAGRRQLSEAVGPSILPPDLDGTGELLLVDRAVDMLRHGKGIPRAAGEMSPAEEDEGAYAMQQRQGRFSRALVTGPLHKLAELLFLGGNDTNNGKRHIFTRLVLVFLFILQIFFLFNKALSIALPG